MKRKQNRGRNKKVLTVILAIVMLFGSWEMAMAAEYRTEEESEAGYETEYDMTGRETEAGPESQNLQTECENAQNENEAAETQAAEMQSTESEITKPQSVVSDMETAATDADNESDGAEPDDLQPVQRVSRSGGIAVDAAHFPDAVFREYLLEYVAGDDGVLSASEMNGVKYLELYYEDVTSLKGIENFPNLQYLFLEGNKLKSLDLRKLKNLKEVECSDNVLTSLKVSGLTKLKKLICSDNDLTSLNLSGLTALEELECSNNALTSLNVRSLGKLEYLVCRENKIRSLDLSGMSRLLNVDCEGNAMTSLKLGSLPALTTLLCGSNSLTSLDISGVPKLKVLYCYQNRLTGLDCTANASLQELEAFTNNMSVLNLAGVKSILSINCSANRITALDVSSAANLVNLIADNNCLPALNLSKNKKLQLTSFVGQVVSAPVLQTKTGYQTNFSAGGFKKGSVSNLKGAGVCADGLAWKTASEIPADNTVTYTYKTGKSGVTISVTVKLTGVKAWTPKPGKVNLYYAKNAKGRKISLKWKKVSGASGYQISYSTSSKFKKSKTKSVTLKKASTKSKVLKGLKKKKIYYVRVRAFTKYGGKKYYGAYSAKKKVKIQK